MYTRRAVILSFLIGICIHAQDSAPTLQVTGDVKRSLTLTASDLAKMPRASVKATFHAVESLYQGVPLHEILKQAGIPLGKDLRGKAMATYVLAQAQDGYQVVFSLAELDPTFIDNQIILADTANGKPLSGDQGRFRIIVPKDKPGARSIRQLSKLEVVQVRK